ncbi:MAG TPA: nucleoside hydrolase [Candidatus Dormibacteraeota bacterium]|jgi:purine nucleosidase|nr:nucleoside hydrolase [Candidatus Dormibacteraeota bacterium]
MATQIILDTDIGTDVDDCLALALILSSPELSLQGVTCVYGDVSLRAAMVRKLLRLRGLDGVPILRGARSPLHGVQPVSWAGHEGAGLLDEGDLDPVPPALHAAQWLVEEVRRRPHQLHLVAVGPLTNVALAFLIAPELPGLLTGLTLMGGRATPLGEPQREHNLLCDPEAARIVLGSGAPIHMIPLDVTTRVRVGTDAPDRIASGGDDFHRAVGEQLRRYPPFADRGWTHLHDPLAVAAVIRPDLVSGRRLRIEVEPASGSTTSCESWARRDPEVALEVDAEAFERFFLDRVSAPAGG